jgi:hypothetical protein
MTNTIIAAAASLLIFVLVFEEPRDRGAHAESTPEVSILKQCSDFCIPVDALHKITACLNHLLITRLTVPRSIYREIDPRWPGVPQSFDK